MANIMENLIEKKYYKTKEEVDKKLNVFYAFKLTSHIKDQMGEYLNNDVTWIFVDDINKKLYWGDEDGSNLCEVDW